MLYMLQTIILKMFGFCAPLMMMTENRAPIGSISDIKGWVSCFENAKFAGTIFAGGVGGPREASGHVAEHEAYEAGRSLLADD